MKYTVNWSRTYRASGTIEIEAGSPGEARAIVEEEIGDYEGSMQYTPDDDIIEVTE